MADDPVAAARRALDQGDYGLVLRLIEPMLEQCSPSSATGADLRLLLATALMGRGRPSGLRSAAVRFRPVTIHG